METHGSFAPFSFDQVLAGCAGLYKAGVKVRYAMYGAGVLKSRRLDRPVISIGNLAVGGVGKTPMAIWLANMLVEKGLCPVVISRGYRGTLAAGAAVVSNGRDLFLDAETCGDEPYMMAMEKSFPVVVGTDRYKAGLMALEALDPDVVILDDGLQHLKLHRDLNLVLLDCRQPLGNGRMLPAGRLRETLCMAKDRIDAVVFTRCPGDGTGISNAKNTIKNKLSVPAFFCRHEPSVVQLFPAGSDSSTADVQTWNPKGKTAVLFSGLARNASFAQSVQALGVNIADHLEFCDHYRYNEPDFKRIMDLTKELEADVVLTTQKDWVKVNPAYFKDVAVAVVGVRLFFFDPGHLETFILENTLDLLCS